MVGMIGSLVWLIARPCLLWRLLIASWKGHEKPSYGIPVGSRASTSSVIDRASRWNLWLQGLGDTESGVSLLVDRLDTAATGLGAQGAGMHFWWAEPGPRYSRDDASLLMCWLGSDKTGYGATVVLVQEVMGLVPAHQ